MELSDNWQQIAIAVLVFMHSVDAWRIKRLEQRLELLEFIADLRKDRR